MATPRRLRQGLLLTGLLLLGLLLLGLTGPATRHWTFSEGHNADAVAVAPDGGHFATLSGTHLGADRVHVFDEGRVIWARALDAVAIAVADPGVTAIAGRTGGVVLYDPAGHEMQVLATGAPARHVALDATGIHVAALFGAPRPGVQVWNAESGRRLVDLPMDGKPHVSLAASGAAFAAASSESGSSRLYLYALDGGRARSLQTATIPGPLTSLDISDDGRHLIAVTPRAAWLFSRDHERPVGVVPDVEPDGADRYRAGRLAGDGQSLLLLAADGRTLHHHKWGEPAPRWTWRAEHEIRGLATSADGEIAGVVPETGPVVVLSLKAGRPLRTLDLDAAPTAWGLSRDGRALVVADASGAVHRAATAPGGLLGLLPHAVVATLYALPPILPAVGLVLATTVLLRPTLTPLWRRWIERAPGGAPERPLTPALDRPPAWARRLDEDIVLGGLTVQAGRRTLLDGVDLRIPAGRLTVVVGGSGEGKTTLLGALVGARRTTGTIHVGARTARPESAAWHRLVGHVAQRPALYDALTPAENLIAFASPYGIDHATARERAEALLHLVGLHAHDRPVARLSGGERQRVSIAVALMPGPAVLLLDEPTSGLDPYTRRQVWDLLNAIRDACGTTFVVSSHALDEAERADHVVLIEQGRVLAAGTPAAIVHSVPDAASFEDAFLRLLDEARRGSTSIEVRAARARATPTGQSIQRTSQLPAGGA